jgi:hypothetical protein
VYNQRTELTKAPEPGLLAGVLPISPINQVGMLTGYVDPGERFIADPNQDVVYGLGYLSLEKEPVDAAAKDPEVMTTLREAAFAADEELIAPMMWWRYNGVSAGNGWTTPTNNAEFGTDYYHRTGAVSRSL